MKGNSFFCLLLVIVVAFALFSGCARPEPAVSEGEVIGSIEEKKEDLEIVQDEESTEIEKEGVPSPLSGIYTREENIQRRPIAVMLDNQSKARPQAGLDQAEIVYEMLAEGWITRYMAIFLIHEPETIGPVRSARPYFIDKALEYDALYVHVGGSPQAFADIKKLKVADIDAMSRGGNTFWRKPHKKAPHNMYTSARALREAAQNSNYKKTGEFEPLLFHREDKSIGGSPASYVEIPYYRDYHPSFQYNAQVKKYYRFINGQPHLDEVSNAHLYAKNIIIQKCSTKIIDSEGRLEIEVTGKGRGYYLANGEMVEITWEKKSRRAGTKYYDANGDEIRLNPGITWIEVIPDDVEIVFE
ncbi:DUF3048 domain-containing protein [Thermotalea metallivorans]|uniref:Putative lipoprotein YerB n=1 Tax=Thermotalea metallivorans TaxID=520762 RepID=A0A140L5Q5_9FIRM|nr:DUF3048 domain-containing protein [Thermotalea metallivorans]KXG75880.1 putative lipoprotein YerB [Thermotalea metallivorans]